MMKNMTTITNKYTVYRIVKKFIDENNIACAETIYQTDRVIQNAYEFIESLCDVVGYKELEDE